MRTTQLNTDALTVGLANCQSVRNKTESIVDHITEHDIDVMAFTETWLNGDQTDNVHIGDLTPKGYKFKHVPVVLVVVLVSYTKAPLL